MTDIVRLTDRIYDIAKEELPKRALDLHPLGIDVFWGIWDMPNGGQRATLAMLVAFRATGPRGEVLLGNVPPITISNILSGLYPSEAEIKSGVETVCNAAREHIRQQAAQANGNAVGNQPFRDAMDRFQRGQN